MRVSGHFMFKEIIAQIEGAAERQREEEEKEVEVSVRCNYDLSEFRAKDVPGYSEMKSELKEVLG